MVISLSRSSPPNSQASESLQSVMSTPGHSLFFHPSIEFTQCCIKIHIDSLFLGFWHICAVHHSCHAGRSRSECGGESEGGRGYDGGSACCSPSGLPITSRVYTLSDALFHLLTLLPHGLYLYHTYMSVFEGSCFLSSSQESTSRSAWLRPL